MLKMTRVALEKISDPDKYMFFEQRMRGGVSYINKRYSKTCAMKQYLLISNFKWVKNIDKIEQKLMRIKNNSSTGYILKVDLEYPKKLHDIHSDYPLAPEKINIPKE